MEITPYDNFDRFNENFNQKLGKTILIISCALALVSVSVLIISQYPNPANNNLTVRLNINSNTNNKIEVYNSLGKQVLSVQNSGAIDGRIIVINTSSLTNGIYFVNIINNEQILRKKFVISR